MPNSFLGFPVRRAMLADYALKTDTIADLYQGAGLFLLTWFDSLDGYYSASSPAGGVTLSSTGVTLTTAGGGTDWASLYKDPTNFTTQLSWAKQAKFKTEPVITATGSSLPIMDICLGERATGRHVGFKVDGGKLYGSVGNGSAETLTPAIEDWGASGYYKQKTLEVRYDGSKADFYVDGVLMDTLNTGLPTGTTNAGRLMRAYVASNGSANYHGIVMSYWKAWKEQ